MRRVTWPIHSRYVPGEALSSWLTRTAAFYGLSPELLLQLSGIDFAPASGDGVPKPHFIEVLADASGMQPCHLRRMTLAHHLSHGSQPIPLFADYIYSSAFLVRPEQPFGARVKPPGVPWLPQLFRPVLCSKCFAQDGVVQMAWPLGLVTTCPRHRLTVAISYSEQQPVHDPALLWLDGLTLSAVQRGCVVLPSGRRLPGRLWLRILRSMIDDLAGAESHYAYGWSVCSEGYRQVWQSLPMEPPGASNKHLAFEDEDPAYRTALFRAAAHAMRLIIRNELPVQVSSLAALLKASLIQRESIAFPLDRNAIEVPSRGCMARMPTE